MSIICVDLIVIMTNFFFVIRPATVCDWEGTPTHILYVHPYIIAIDPYFIEVRHVETVSALLFFKEN